MAKKFKFKVTLRVTDNWIEAGVTSVNIKEKLIQFLQEELNPDSYEGEYIAEVK